MGAARSERQAVKRDSNDDIHQRVAALSVIVGAIVTAAINFLHPWTENIPWTARLGLRMIAHTGSPVWVLVHLFLAVGIRTLAISSARPRPGGKPTAAGRS